MTSARPPLHFPSPEPDDAARRLLVGNSPAMAQLRWMVRLAAGSDAPVVLHGPTGSGKEVAARALHALGGEVRPFVAVNCGAIPAELIESELFGHERGSFTGASQRRVGRFEAANGGTLFLDEIGDMPLAAQVRLLRVLETCEFERVGSVRSIPFTGRVVCATHRDLAGACREGRFREDLWYRLAVWPVTMPALVDRREDIGLLCEAIIARQGLTLLIDDAAIARLSAHDWPGNVRELRTILTRAAVFADDGRVEADKWDALIAPAGSPGTAALAPVLPDADLRGLLDAIERQQLLAALEISRWTVAAAARRVGLSRTTFADRMRRYGLDQLQSEKDKLSVAQRELDLSQSI
jgi:sigma-54 specific flagellar transcriptional regulator A